MSDPAKPRRVRLDITRVPESVRADRTKWPAWQRLWRRIMLRWVLFALAWAVPYGTLALLTFRARLIPESITLTTLWILFVIAVPLMFLIRRWAQRQMEDYAKRELPEHEWS